MVAWITFLKERFPLPTYILLVGGFASSGLALVGGGWNWTAFLGSFIGLMLFFAVLRMMDELKDYEKDRVAHPNRPLPRGVLALSQVQQMIKLLVFGMMVYAAASFVFSDLSAGLTYLLVTGYLWLMYREFYCGPWLSARPVLYATSHQVIIIPLCYYCVLVNDAGLWRQPEPFYFACVVLGAFFTYEVCRKLDPNAHPVLQTYLHCYGPLKTSLLVCCTSAVSAVGPLGLSSGILLWPVEGLLLVTLPLLFLAPGKFKVIEGVATVSLLLHLWIIPLRHLLISMG